VLAKLATDEGKSSPIKLKGIFAKPKENPE
jgi:hypothetical protein